MGTRAVLLATLLMATNFSCILSRARRDENGRGDAGGPPTCRARVAGLRFNESRPPHVKNSWEPLIACYSFSNYTCCSRNDSESIKRLNLMSASAGHSAKCRSLTERFNCMPCDGDVGTGLKPAACTSFCDQWFDACRSEYYKTSQDGSTIKPCFGDYLVCSPLSEIVSGGADLCGVMGVKTSDDAARCYDGSPYPPGKRGLPEPHLPSDDVDVGGFRFRKGGGALSDLVRALKQAWDRSTQMELAAAAACVATALFLFFTLTCRMRKSQLQQQHMRGRRFASSAPGSSSSDSDDSDSD